MGGGDVNANPRLRTAMEAARGENMPADNITKAIKRGTGEMEGVSYDEITYEGTGPGGTLFLVDVLTDNRNRSVAELRKIFEKAGSTMGAAGTASWAYERKGQIKPRARRPPRRSSSSTWPSAPAPKTSPMRARSGSSPPPASSSTSSERPSKKPRSRSRAPSSP
jgi:transcriptional/translational regulatory protein YebC/TACO1